MEREITAEEWKQFTEKHILSKPEVQEIIGAADGNGKWHHSSYNQAVNSGRLKPIHVFGEGKHEIRLFLDEDVYQYKATKRNRPSNRKKPITDQGE